MFIRMYINWKSLFHPLKSGGILHPLVNLYERYKYGAGCCDVFSLYYYLSKKILPSLKRFKTDKVGYPMCYVKKDQQMTPEIWEDMIDAMIYSFESIEKDNNCEKINYKKQQKGFELFGKHFRDLWY